MLQVRQCGSATEEPSCDSNEHADRRVADQIGLRQSRYVETLAASNFQRRRMLCSSARVA